jgi:Photosynthesis system II assembly factor YCF48
MLKYTLRYAPLLILALLLIYLHFSMDSMAGQKGLIRKAPASSPRGISSALYSIASLPDGEAWSVGGSFTVQPAPLGTLRGSPVPSSGIILHYVGNTWTPARFAGQLHLPLLSVSLDSPHDGWAVGWVGTLVHYDGHVWSTRPGPANFKQNLLGVAMLSSTNGWVVGNSGTILHYDGKQWALVSSPTTVDLHSVAFPSPSEGWAVGVGGTILHFHHGAWTVVSPSPTGGTLNSISMLSTDEGWAVGNQDTILHYRNGTWESIHPVNYYQHPSSSQAPVLSGIAMNSIRSGWIVGGLPLLTYSSEAWIEPNEIDEPSNVLAHLNLFSITISPIGEGWAVGSIDGYNAMPHSPAGIILHYEAGKWIVALDLFFIPALK